MNLLQKKNELIRLIFEYLDNRVSLEDLREFSWQIIDYFNKSKQTELPEYQNFERELWYAIWQIQHLADEEHEKEGITKKVLLESLNYLTKKTSLPDDLIGRRP